VAFVLLPAAAAADFVGRTAGVLRALLSSGDLTAVQVVRVSRDWQNHAVSTIVPAAALTEAEIDRLLDEDCLKPGRLDVAEVLADFLQARPGRAVAASLFVGPGVPLPESSLLGQRAGRWAWYLTQQRRLRRQLAFAGFVDGHTDRAWVEALRELAALSPGTSRFSDLVLRWAANTTAAPQREAALLTQWSGRLLELATRRQHLLARNVPQL
jgi:hypothetical protein